ncbi:MAG: hypothetical protein A2Z97_06960 [Bdellovibrionales bacterium GWB1_52_6]|nr:MAG: hypothetical protein A2Z97_06960 [Bdellovibrionales bacterium GWB1_52_6]OFZ05454.1 MAG: hypothetical protein A2X97_11290 [Bdellovibrionales bacterium GWA1_52_35]HCM39183.1 ATP-dependent DNA helicase Rep [Bdellovibrionales bacterium]
MNLSRLNTRQREAVLHGEGPLLILAGAGSGKTSTMAYRIAHLISVRKFPARAILGLSFTNKAAAELKERVTGLVTQTCGQDALKELTVSTFHSLCVKILRAYGHKLGFQNNFTIMDASDQRDVLKQVFKNVRIDDRKFDLDRILFQIGQAKGRFLGPAHAQDYFLGSGSQLPGDYGIAAATSYEHYQGQLKAQNAMDFDDLLFNAVTLLETFKDVREHYNQRFKYVLVDEYQDTNPAQFKLLRLLTEQQQNLCVVGDDDQSIYAWRGADPTHILEFAHQFKDARTITLDQNYRSTTTILDAANSVISNNKHRHPKKLWSERGEGEPIQEMVLADDREEARYVAEEIFRLAKEQKRRWSDFAVLYRSNTQSRVFEESLRLLRVPYKIVGGYSFLERKEVKNTLAYWRLASNPDDDASLRRVLNWPARGFGKTTLEALGNEAFSSGKSLYETLKRAGEVVPRAAGAAAQFVALVESARLELAALENNGGSGSEALVRWAQQWVEKFSIKKGIEEDCEEPAQVARKWENVEELLHALGQVRAKDVAIEETGAADFGAHLLREFLARMVLDAQDSEDREKDAEAERDQVTLLTLHGAKGLEYPVVFLVGAEDGLLPHQRTLDEKSDLGEERRLCYVGITRARDHLLLTRAKNRIRYGKPVPRYRSRFLAEIPESMILARDESGGVEPIFDKKARDDHEQKVKNYLAEIRARIGSKN